MVSFKGKLKFSRFLQKVVEKLFVILWTLKLTSNMGGTIYSSKGRGLPVIGALWCIWFIGIVSSSRQMKMIIDDEHDSHSNQRPGIRKKLVENVLGLTPQFGWNSWNHFQCNIDEKLIRETADAMVSTGLAALGYEYINLDDCWAELNRDSQGNMVPKASTFPSGIKALADYIRGKRLKLGIYSDAWTQTCSKQMTGSLVHEEQDAKTFASWDES